MPKAVASPHRHAERYPAKHLGSRKPLASRDPSPRTAQDDGVGRGPCISLDEHGVALAEEAVALVGGDSVEPALFVETHERRDECDQRAARKVEVRDQRADVLPGVRGEDKDARLVRLWF